MTRINQNGELLKEVIGVIAAGGEAKRIAPLPCSKELYPIGFRLIEDGKGLRPKVACHYLLEKMSLAGINKVYIILRQGKWDIPTYLGDGSMFNINYAYLMMGLPFGTPFTLDQAYPFVQNALLAFGFPDIIFEPNDAFVRLLDRQRVTNADIILGLFPTDQPQKVDMVDIDEEGKVGQILIKPNKTELRYTWCIAIWTPVFTKFLHEYVNAYKSLEDGRPELSLGNVIQASILNGLQVEAVKVSTSPYLDIGTPEDLAKAVRRFASE
jgi:glucose-1-phosphate thymidylyltransferase